MSFATTETVHSIINNHVGGSVDILFRLTTEGKKLYIYPCYDTLIAKERPGIEDKLPIYDAATGMFYVYKFDFDEMPDAEETTLCSVSATLAKPTLTPFQPNEARTHYSISNTIRILLSYYRIKQDIMLSFIRGKERISDYEYAADCVAKSESR